MTGVLRTLCGLAVVLVSASLPSRTPDAPPKIAILAYHRFSAGAVTNAMTVQTSTFRWQLDYLTQHGYPIVSLSSLVTDLRGGAAPPRHAVVITVDDGHASVYSEMLPVVREFGIPVTLFVYPSAISNASYALTWSQLEALRQTGLFDVQSHTWWHPNFKTERHRLAPAAYRVFATRQFVTSRTILRERLGVSADIVAWPFGIFDEELMGIARDSGFVAGLTLDRRFLTGGDDLMALPRFLVTDEARGAAFAAMLPRADR